MNKKDAVLERAINELKTPYNFSSRWQRWFSVGILPLVQLFGLISP